MPNGDKVTVQQMQVGRRTSLDGSRFSAAGEEAKQKADTEALDRILSKTGFVSQQG